MPSNREAKIQRLIQASKLKCNECGQKNFLFCMYSCEYHRWVNDQLLKIQDNGGCLNGV